jgi:hypothetical protein
MIMRTVTVPRVLPGGKVDGVTPAQTPRYGAGRTCAAEGCDTRLSSYNPARWCWIHEAPSRFIARAERRSPSAEEEPEVVEMADLLPLVREGTAHHPEPGPEPAPAPTPPPPVPPSRRRGGST